LLCELEEPVDGERRTAALRGERDEVPVRRGAMGALGRRPGLGIDMATIHRLGEGRVPPLPEHPSPGGNRAFAARLGDGEGIGGVPLVHGDQDPQGLGVIQGIGGGAETKSTQEYEDAHVTSKVRV